MPRIRTIKPSAFSSESLAAVSVEARWTFAGLWTYVDDEGRGKADPRLIKAHVWPLDDAVSPKRVEALLGELEREQMIRRYEVGGRAFLVVVNWKGHQYIQRPKPSSLPSPDASCAEPAKEIDASVSDHGQSTDGSLLEGKGREGNGYTSPDEPATPIAYPPDFEEFWESYPRKVGKAAALRVWQAQRKKVGKAIILAGAQRYRDDPNREDQFTAHPSTWLSRGGWDDDPVPARGRSPQLTKAGAVTPW